MILVVTLKFKEHLLNVILQGNGEQGSSEAENPGALASDISTFSSYHTNITEERYLLEFVIHFVPISLIAIVYLLEL